MTTDRTAALTPAASALNNGLFDPAYEFEITTASIDELTAWNNPRSDIEQETTEELEHDLVTVGSYLHDLSVIIRDGKKCVFVGGRRLKAAKKVVADGKLPGSHPLNIRVYPNLTDAQATELANHENLKRKQMNNMDVAAFVASKAHLGTVELARRLNMTTSDVEALILVNGSELDDVKDALRENVINPRQAAMLCLLDEHYRTATLKGFREGRMDLNNLARIIRNSDIMMETALFDHEKYTGKIDSAFALLDLGGTRIGKDEASREEWLRLQVEAAREEAQQRSDQMKCAGGRAFLLDDSTQTMQNPLRSVGYKPDYSMSGGDKYVVATVSPHTGYVQFHTSARPIDGKTVKEVSPTSQGFQQDVKASDAAYKLTGEYLRTQLSALGDEDHERYALALTVIQAQLNITVLGGSRRNSAVAVPGLAQVIATSGQPEIHPDTQQAAMRHIINLDIATLRKVAAATIYERIEHTGIRTTTAYQAIVSNMPDLTPAPITEAYLKQLSLSNLTALAKMLPVAPRTTSGSRKKLTEAILSVANANAKAGFEVPGSTVFLKKGADSSVNNTATEPAAPVEAAPGETGPSENATAQENSAPENTTLENTVTSEAPAAPVDAAEAAQDEADEIDAEADEEGRDTKDEVAELAPAEVASAEVAPAEVASTAPTSDVANRHDSAQEAVTDTSVPTTCKTCGNTREIWDEELCDCVPCPECSAVSSMKA